MQTPESARRQIIENALSHQPEAVVQTTIRLWELLAPELIAIIGQGGFTPLYARSIRLVCKQHAWLAQHVVRPSDKERFTELRTGLQAQDPAQAHLASLELFTIFLDVLASLVGDELTTHLLHSAWSKETTETPAKDLPK